MKVVLDLPDWCDNRNIYILAGIELVAYNLVTTSNTKTRVWKVKTGRCSYCGKCCFVKGDLCIRHRMEGDKIMCGQNLGRPVSCTVKDFSYIPECTEKFEDVK